MLLTHGNQEICSSYQMELWPPQPETFLGFYTLLSSPGSTGYQDLAAGFWWTQQSSVHHRDPRTYSTGYQDLAADFWWTQQSSE